MCPPILGETTFFKSKINYLTFITIFFSWSILLYASASIIVFNLDRGISIPLDSRVIAKVLISSYSAFNDMT